MKVGGEIIDITPDYNLPNYNGFLLHKEEKDRLLCQALVINDGKKDIAIASLDTTFIQNDIVQSIREKVSKKTGISSNNILIAATHTHSAPTMSKSFLNGASPDKRYVNFFIEKTVVAIIQAKKKLEHAFFLAGISPAPGFEYNRRLQRPDGRIIMNYASDGLSNNCLPTGPTDKEIPFLLFKNLSGLPIGIIFNYDNHNNCINAGYYSQDFGGKIGNILRKRLGSVFPVVFLPGACGNVNWINSRNPGHLSGDKLAWKIGEVAANKLLNSLKKSSRTEKIDILVKRKAIEVQERPFTYSDFCNDNNGGNSEERKIADRNRYEPEIAEIKKRGETICPVEIYVISFDDISIVTNPVELFTEFGMEIKRRSPFKITLVSTLTNGYYGYVPTQEAFYQGGYETRRTVYTSRLAVDAGRRIAEKSIELLNLNKEKIENS